VIVIVVVIGVLAGDGGAGKDGCRLVACSRAVNGLVPLAASHAFLRSRKRLGSVWKDFAEEPHPVAVHDGFDVGGLVAALFDAGVFHRHPRRGDRTRR